MASNTSKHTDQHGRDQGTSRICIREDATAGICLGNGVDVYPGEECTVPAPVAAALVAQGKARYVEAPVPAPVVTPETEPVAVPETDPVRTPEPVVTSPAPPRGGRRAR